MVNFLYMTNTFNDSSVGKVASASESITQAMAINGNLQRAEVSTVSSALQQQFQRKAATEGHANPPPDAL